MTWGSTEPPSASMASCPAWLTASELLDTEDSLNVKVDINLIPIDTTYYNDMAPKILNKDVSKPCLFTFYQRLAQAENNVNKRVLSHPY